jgi:type I restriction enzyme S subunit
MSEWVTSRLTDLILPLQSGKRPPGGVSADGDGVPSLGGENISLDGRLVLDTVNRIPPRFALAMTKGAIEPGDILINKDGAQTGKVAMYRGELGDARVNEHVFILRADTRKIDPDFLFQCMFADEVKIQVSRRITGSAQPGLGRSFADHVFIYHPVDVSVQRECSAVLDRLSTQIAHTEALIAKQEQVRAGLMQDLFTRGVDETGRLRPPREEAPELYHETALGWLPKGWSVRNLESLVRDDRPIVYGILMPGSGYPDGVPVVEVRSIKKREIVLSDILLTSPKLDKEYQRSRLLSGDIVFATRGTVGRVAIVPEMLAGANVSRDIVRLSVIADYRDFVWNYMESHVASNYYWKNTIGNAVQGINIKDIKRMPVSLPSQEEANKIAKILCLQLEKIAALRQCLKKLQMQRAGLLRDLLTPPAAAAVTEADAA